MSGNTPAPPADTLIRDAYVVTVDELRRVFTSGYLAMTDGRISAVGPMSDPLPQAREVIDGSGMVLLPGIANGHNHLVQNALRGYNDDRWPVLDIPAAVKRLLEQLFAAAACMDEARTYAIVRLHALELLKCGYTATHDEHFTNVRKDSVDGSWQAIADSGLRGFLCRCVVDDRVPEAGHETIDEGLAEIARLRRFASERVTVAASFVNYSFLQNPAAMRELYAGARQLGVAFGIDMTDNSRGALLRARGFSGGQVDYYAEHGLLDGPPIYAGKGVNLLPHEFALLAGADARLALVPVLRFFDAQGLPVHDMLGAGMLPGLGTDAPLVSDSQDPFEAMRMAILAQNLAVKARIAQGGDRPDASLWLNAERTIEMATLGGARALLMEHDTGSLAVGKAADCVLLRVDVAELAPTWHDARLLGSLVWGGHAGLVDSVFVAGERLIANGHSTRWDEQVVLAEAEAAAAAIREEAGLDSFLPARQPGSAYRGWTYH